MKMLRRATHAAVVLACCGFLVPSGAIAAAPQAATSHRDVTLTPGGALRGTVVNAEGIPLDGAQVSVHRNGQELARTVSHQDGSFEVVGMRNGAYELAVGQQVVPVRLWSVDAAPPSAREEALLVVGNVVRGQDGVIVEEGFGPGFGPPLGLDIITLWTVGASTGALVLTAVNQADLNDIQDKLDRLQSP